MARPEMHVDLVGQHFEFLGELLPEVLDAEREKASRMSSGHPALGLLSFLFELTVLMDLVAQVVPLEQVCTAELDRPAVERPAADVWRAEAEGAGAEGNRVADVLVMDLVRIRSDNEGVEDADIRETTIRVVPQDELAELCPRL